MTQSDSNHIFEADRQIPDIERHIADQHAYVLRMIVRGEPTQAAEDRLREVEQKLAHRRKARHPSRAGG